MQRALLLALAVGIAVGTGCSSTREDYYGPGQPPPEMTVVLNADVYTVDVERPRAEALAYDSRGIIIAVGTREEVLAAAGPGATMLDARGHMVLPGFQDAHVHVPEAGINEGMCLVEPGRQLRYYVKEVAACARRQAGDGWVRVAGASLFNLRGSAELPIDALDRAIPERPVLVLDDLGHAAWTNSAGLRAAGIGPDDADPQGGVYHRDPASGRLSGLLLEDAQQRLRSAAALDDEANYAGLLVALRELARNGFTSVSDAGGYWGQRHPDAWQRALSEETLTVRARNSLYLYPSLDVDAQLAEFAARFRDDPASLLQFDTAKVYVDGILDLGTAALIEPYDHPVDPTRPRGFFYFEPEVLKRYVAGLHRLGYRVEFHVIGDSAVRAALDAVEAVPADRAEVASRRHRATHTYLVYPADVHRFAALGVVADFQLGPESSSSEYQEYLSDFIGDRAFDLIPLGEMLKSGAHVSLSSDWDADPLSPFGIIQRAVTRKTNAVDSVQTAVRLLTLDAAYALGQEDTTGSIEVGKFADFIVVDRDLLKAKPGDIGRAQVLLTVVGGREVFRSGRLRK